MLRLLPLLALLQSASAPEPPSAPQAPAAPERQELEETVQIYFVHEVRKELGLDAEQALKLLPLVERLDAARGQARDARLEQLRGLRRMSGSDETTREQVRAALDALDAIEASSRAEQHAIRDQMLELMEPHQQAGFVLFVERFRGRLERRLQEMRGGAGRPRGARPPRWREGQR